MTNHAQTLIRKEVDAQRAYLRSTVHRLTYHRIRKYPHVPLPKPGRVQRLRSLNLPTRKG